MVLNFVEMSVIEEDGNSFGILVRTPSGRTLVFTSVSTRYERALEICEVVNRSGVSECHVYDVLEDLLL